LNGNKIKIKHYISKMKADIKFCSSSFSVITFPVHFLLGQDHLLGIYKQH